MDAYEITVLAEDLANKRLRREMLAMRNVYGLSHDERTKLDIEYHIADVEYLEVFHRLEKTKRWFD